jgi:NADPH-dependent 2,4-dienoyl-CoA reductase/sulfur reductase-like enzyme
MLSLLDAEFVLSDSVVSPDQVRRTVSTASGRELRTDSIVVATGLRARVLPGQTKLEGVHLLRTLG